MHGWTRKEAYLKALGVGLSGDLQTFAVAMKGAARLLHVDESADTIWTMADLSQERIFCAALTTAGQDGSLIRKQWPPD